jgi:cytochrome b subunit of formate dehydrogenase
MLVFLEQKLSFAGTIRKLVYLLALLSFVILAITGFYPTLVKGEHISGYLIMIHATFGPVLAICLAVLAVMWAGKSVFNIKDWPWLQRLIEQVTLNKTDENSSEVESCVWQKITFWLILFLSLPLIMSIILSMLPYFGTYWQELFIFIHRYTALVFSIVVLIHTHLIVIAQLKK